MSKFPKGSMMKCSKDGKLMKSSDNGLIWTEIQIASMQGSEPFFTSLASDASGEHLIASTTNHGVFLSHDSGESWQAAGLNAALKWMDVTSDAIGENLVAISETGGIYFSIDHGHVWKESASVPKDAEWRSIVADRTGQYLTATSNKEGLYTSFDYGVTWVKAHTPTHVKKWRDVTMDFTGQYLAAVAPGHGIYHSSDHGLTWLPLLESSAAVPGIIVPHEESAAKINNNEWKSVASDSTGQFLAAVNMEGKVFLSNDYGHAWRMAVEFPSHQACSAVTFDGEGKVLFALAGDEAVFFSSDKGATWSTHFSKIQSTSVGAASQPVSVGTDSEAFNSLFKGYQNFVPRINEEKAVKDDTSGQFQNLFDNYKSFMDVHLQATHAPSSRPSHRPSHQPYAHPTGLPSGQPTTQPTNPTGQPSSQPTRTYPENIAFSFSQVLSGLSFTDYQANKAAIDDVIITTANHFIEASGVVDQVISTLISSAVANIQTTVSSVSVDLAANSVKITTSSAVQINKQHTFPLANLDNAYATIGQTYAASVANGDTTTFMQTTAVSKSVPQLVSATVASSDFSATYSVTGVNTFKPTFRPTSAPSDLPTSIPSMQPFGFPTSMPSVDITKIIPTVTASVDSTTTSTAKVILTFGSLPPLSGTIYCMSFATGASTLTSSNYITSLAVNGISVAYGAKDVSESITLTGLVPSTTYDVFCAVQNSVGHFTAFSDVQGGKLGLTTTCCKTVSYTTAPSFVFNAADLYTKVAANAGKNVFAFALDYLPTGSITLTPNFVSGSGAFASTISPFSFTFTSASPTLTGTFSILGNDATFEGTGTMTLTISGTSASEYGTNPAVATSALKVVSQANTPAPNFVSAQMGDNALTVTLTFDGNTDLGGKSLSTPFLCKRFFTFGYLDQNPSFNNSLSCSWNTPSTVVVTFPAGWLPDMYGKGGVNLDVTVKSGSIHAQCTSAVCVNPPSTPQKTVSIASPLNPGSPNIVLTAPTLISGCSNATVDATGTTGNYGVDWNSVSFQIASAYVDVTSAQNVLNKFSDTKAIISIPGFILPSTTYHVTLTVTNVFGKTSSSSVSFFKSGDSNIPSASIVGSNVITMKVKNALSITASGTPSPCGNPKAVLSFAWVLTDQSGAVVPGSTSTSLSPRTYSLNGYTLKRGSLYTATLTVTSTTDGIPSATASSTATATIKVGYGNIIAQIAGAKNLLISQSTSLDASGSYDEDLGPGGNAGFTYTWTCTSLTAATYGADCTTATIATADATKAALPVNYDLLFPSNSYNFQVVVKSSDGRMATAAVVVNTVAFDPKTASIVAQVAISDSSTFTKLYQGQSGVTIHSSISSSIQAKVKTWQFVTANWSAYYGSDSTNTLDLSTIASSSFGSLLNVSNVRPLSGYDFPFVFKTSTINPGTSLTFRLSLYNHGNVMSYSEILYTVVTNPSGGLFTVDPQTGTAVTTTFSLLTYGWIDDVSNLPLTYDFRYIYKNNYYTISTVGLSNKASAALPQGTDTSTGGIIGLSARVYNVYGGKTEIFQAVTVNKPATVDTAALNNLINSATQSGDATATVAAISVVGASLGTIDCSAAPNCANLNRQSCLNTPQTCSSCLAGYIGVYGDSNIKCIKKKAKKRRLTEVGGAPSNAIIFSYYDVESGISQTAVTCATDDDCPFGHCDTASGFCVDAPIQVCPNSCSNQGVCGHFDLSGNAFKNASTCTVDNTYCQSYCMCNKGWGGSDCSVNITDIMKRDSSRGFMCETLLNAIKSTNPSSSVFDSFSSALSSSFNKYEVVSNKTRVACFAIMEAIATLASDGYITSDQLPADQTDTSSSIQTFMNILSDYVVTGDSSSVEAAVTKLSSGVMSLLASGQSGVLLTTTNLKLSFNKLRFADTLGQQFTIPQSDEESLYGSLTPMIEFTDKNPAEIINACSNFGPVVTSSDLGNDHNYFTFSFGGWNANPFAQAETFKTAVIRTQTLTNNTVNVHSANHEILYYITYPFTSDHAFHPHNKPGQNKTFPICAEFVDSLTGHVNIRPSVCKSCNVSTYDNSSITFACTNMDSLCGSPSSNRRMLSATSGGWVVSNTGSAVQSQGIPIPVPPVPPAITDIFGKFDVNVRDAIPILIAVGGLVGLLLLAFIYFYQWDISDYYFAKYSGQLKYSYTSMMHAGNNAIGVGGGNADQSGAAKQMLIATSVSEDMTFGAAEGKSKFEKILSNGVTAVNDALFILHNSFPAIVYQDNNGASGSSSIAGGAGDRGSRWSIRNSMAGKSVLNLLARNDYFSMFNPDNYNYHRAVKLMQALIQIITILFISTLFYYIFYPDRGQCESYKSEGDCRYHKNLITQEGLCSWSSELNPVDNTRSNTCSLHPPELNVPFIMLLATVMTMISMPVVMMWNLLFLNICATIPPSWLKFFLRENDPVAEPVTEGELREEEESSGDVTSNNKYQVTRHAQRTTRTPNTSFPTPSLSGSAGPAEMSSELYYVNRIPVAEEMEILFQAVQRFYHELDHSVIHSIRNQQQQGFLTPVQAKMLYIYYSLGIDSNFHTMPLSLRQQLKYGSWMSLGNDHIVRYHNTQANPSAASRAAEGSEMVIQDAAYQRIKQKLTRSREESEEIVAFLQARMNAVTNGANSHGGDQAMKKRDIVMLNNIQLLQFFIFEQFPIYQKYLLFYFFHHTYIYSNLHLFNAMPADLQTQNNSILNQMLWILKGLVLLGALVYQVYFILSWSVVSQDNTFESWGINYCIIVAEQLLIIQWIQNYFVQNIIYSLLLPKLQIIYSTVHQKLVTMASSAASTPRGGAEKGPIDNHKSFAITPRSVLTGLSFRGSISDANILPVDYTASRDMNDSQFGASSATFKDEFPVNQVLSPVARACKTAELNRNLIICRMINSFTDYDMVNLKSQLSELSMQFSKQPVTSRRFSLSTVNGALNNPEANNDDNNGEPRLYYKEIGEWKQYSLFHMIAITIPLFMIQGIFQVFFFCFPFLSKSLYAKSFVLNGFHLSYFNMLFSYIIPSLISLLVIVCYYFFTNVPLPAAIITTVVVLLLAFFITVRRVERFWTGMTSSAGGRRRRGGGEGFISASLGALASLFLSIPRGIGRVISLVFFPFSAQTQQHRTNEASDQQWQRQNIPSSLQSITMGADTTAAHDSYLLSLLSNQQQTAGAIASVDHTLPNEIRSITASPTAATAGQKPQMRLADSIVGKLPSSEYYLSSLLDQSYYDEKRYEEYLLSKYKVRKPEEGNKKLGSVATLSSRTAPLTDVGNNEHMILVDPSNYSPGIPEGKSEEDHEVFDMRTVGVSTIGTVNHLRYLVAHILTTPATSANANHRYYNLYHKATEDVQIGLLRAVSIFFLQSVDRDSHQEGSPATILNLLNHIFSVSEQIFRQPLTDTALPSSEQTIDANECTEIMQQFFQFFVPALSMPSLSSSERTEIINDFYQFLVMHDYSWDRVPFPAFILWFRLIMDKTVKYKLVLQYSVAPASEGGNNGSNGGGGGSGNGSEDGKSSDGSGSGSSGRGRYQYQMNYQRIQRTAMTDTNRLTEGLSSTHDDDESVATHSTPVVRAVKQVKEDASSPEKASGNFSSPRRVPSNDPSAAAAPRGIPVQTSADPSNFNETNPLRSTTDNNRKGSVVGKAKLDLSQQLKNLK